jgi:hypothetical protein
MSSSSGSGPKFTAIWQSGESGEGWPLFDWLMRVFRPFIAENVFDGKHQVVQDNAIVFDAWIYANDPEYYKRFKGKNAFLVHIGDEFYQIGADRYRNFRGVFRMLWSSVFNPQHVMTIPLGTYIKESPASIATAGERRYAWSFIGDAEKVSRPDMVRAFSSIEPHVCFSSTPVRGTSFLGGGGRRFSRQEFYAILGQSVFAPSPMGNASLESCRPYDALEMGAIPIVERRLTLDYYRSLLGDHPFPTVGSWAEGRALVKQLLSQPEELDKLQRTCVQWWADYQLRLRERMAAFLERRSGTTDELVPLRSRLPEMPFWNYAELLRHHNASALYRRVTRQFTRLAKQGKWRTSTRPGVPPNSSS